MGLAALLADLVSSFSMRLDTFGNNISISCINRRDALANLIAAPSVVASTLLTSSYPAVADDDSSASSGSSSSSTSTNSGAVFTVVIESQEAASNVGIQFADIKIDDKDVPSVEKVFPDSIASASGVKPGMVLLGKDSATKSSSVNVNFQIRNGPWPFVMQFATQEEAKKLMASSVDESQQQQQQQRGRLRDDPYGPIMVKKQIPSNCDMKAKRGDTVTISYEARIGSSTGPIYDSSAWRGGKSTSFELGKSAALPGVEIGMNNMCVGEVRDDVCDVIITLATTQRFTFY